MVVLIVILFAAQGGLVQTYDVKCLLTDKLTRDADNSCPAGTLNPFYAGDLYFELDTEKYW
jgi:hypothetical protein